MNKNERGGIRTYAATVLAALLMGTMAFAGGVGQGLWGRGGTSSGGSSYTDAQAQAATGWAKTGTYTETTLGDVRMIANGAIRFGAPGAAAIIHTVAGGWEFDFSTGAAAWTIAGPGLPFTTTGGFSTTADVTTRKVLIGTVTDQSADCDNAATGNASAGKVCIQAGQGSMVLTNSSVTTSSIIQLTNVSDDTTCLSPYATVASGSMTIGCVGAATATANTVISFLVIN